MAKLSDECTEHLERALRADDPSTKDFHIRQVLQACAMDDVPEPMLTE